MLHEMKNYDIIWINLEICIGVQGIGISILIILFIYINPNWLSISKLIPQ